MWSAINLLNYKSFNQPLCLDQLVILHWREYQLATRWDKTMERNGHWFDTGTIEKGTDNRTMWRHGSGGLQAQVRREITPIQGTWIDHGEKCNHNIIWRVEDGTNAPGVTDAISKAVSYR